MANIKFRLNCEGRCCQLLLLFILVSLSFTLQKFFFPPLCTDIHVTPWCSRASCFLKSKQSIYIDFTHCGTGLRISGFEKNKNRNQFVYFFILFFFAWSCSSSDDLDRQVGETVPSETVQLHLVTATFLWPRRCARGPSPPLPPTPPPLLPIRRNGSVFFYCFIPYLCFSFDSFLGCDARPALTLEWRPPPGPSYHRSPHCRTSTDSTSCHLNKVSTPFVGAAAPVSSSAHGCCNS